MVIAVTLVSVALIAAGTAAFEWRSMTSFSNARMMRVINDTLFIATSGGLLVITDPDLAGKQYTNLDGLGTVDINDIIRDAAGQKWIAGNGRLIKFDGFSSVRYPIIDNDGDQFRLLCVVDDGDYLWLGSDHGLILFSKTIDGGQIQDAFQLFDNLNPAPEVNAVELAGDSIWLATSAGLAVADRSSHTALKSPANWKGYGIGEYPELGSDTIWTVKRFEDSVYIGAAAGLFRLDPATDTLVKLPYPVSSAVRQLRVENDSLFVYSYEGLGVLFESTVTGLSPPSPSALRTGILFGGRRWLGSGMGIYFNDGLSYQEYPFTGLPHNDVTDVAMTPDGLMAVLFRTLGPYEWRSGGWVRRPIFVSNRAIAMQSDRNGQFYVGTFGAGMWRIGDTITQFTTSNSTLQEAGAPGSNYVVCFDVAVTDDYFFGVNFEPRDGTRLAIADLDHMDSPEGWTSLGVTDGLNGAQMVSADYHNQAVVIGSGLHGAFYYHLGPNPFDLSDDSLTHYYQDHPNFRYRIVSNSVRVVRFSPEGELWVGTNFGISRFDLGLESFVDVNLPAGFGPDITAIDFDSRGNAWIGVKNGLVRIDALTGEAEGFTTVNSGLLNDYVFNLTFDPISGNLYVATVSGLSVVLSTIGTPTEDLDSVYAFPNPFVISSSDDVLNFNFAGNARLRIFTLVGELVAELPEPVWDGHNAAGKLAASGVYLYVLTDDGGEVGRGKFLLVRN